MELKPCEKFIMALEGKQICGWVPHLKLVFFLIAHAFGRLYPSLSLKEQISKLSNI